MGGARDDDDPPSADWDDPEQTELDGEFLIAEAETALAPLGMFGFCDGYDLGFKRGTGAAMLALRDELIKGGTDAGTAALVAQKLGRACGVRGG